MKLKDELIRFLSLFSCWPCNCRESDIEKSKLHKQIDDIIDAYCKDSITEWEKTKASERAELDAEKEAWLALKAAEMEQLEKEKSQWEEEKQRVASSQTFGSKIKLDVGGTRFTTTMTTLQRFPESMLGAMFSGRHALVLDEEGYFFIDRDGKHFRHILNFLRDPENYHNMKFEDSVVKELKVEVNYYGLPFSICSDRGYY